MENSQIKALLEQSFSGDQVIVEGDGYHYQIIVISDIFNGLPRVKRTQKIYQVLNEHIQSGELHALSVKPFTVEEWKEKAHG